jgi:hypothetical protein
MYVHDRLKFMYKTHKSQQDWRNSGTTCFQIAFASATNVIHKESFKLLSVYSVPMDTPSIHVWASPSRKHDPLLFVPDGTSIRIFNITRFNHRDVSVFPLDDIGDMQADDDDDELENATGAMYITDTDGDEGVHSPAVYAYKKPAKELFEEVKGWVAVTKRADASWPPVELSNIHSCQVAFGGWVILGVGKRGTLYSWKLKSK